MRHQVWYVNQYGSSGDSDAPSTHLEVVCSLQIATSKPHSHLPRWSMISRNTVLSVTLFGAVISEFLSISPLNKLLFFSRGLLTWDPEFMMGISCAFHFCACRGFKDAHSLAAALAMCLFKMLVLWYTLNIVKMVYICRQQYFEELFRHASGIPQSLSFWIFTLASRTCFSVSWPLLLLSISITFFNMVTSRGGKKKKKWPKQFHSTHPHWVSLHGCILPQVFLFPLLASWFPSTSLLVCPWTCLWFIVQVPFVCDGNCTEHHLLADLTVIVVALSHAVTCMLLVPQMTRAGYNTWSSFVG